MLHLFAYFVAFAILNRSFDSPRNAR